MHFHFIKSNITFLELSNLYDMFIICFSLFQCEKVVDNQGLCKKSLTGIYLQVWEQKHQHQKHFVIKNPSDLVL